MSHSANIPFILILAITFLLSSCDLFNKDGDSEPEPTYPPLEGTQWTLEAFEPEEGKPMFVENIEELYVIYFETDSTVKGYGGCNQCWGDYEISSNGEIHLYLGCPTRARCTWSPDYERALGGLVTKYEVRGDKLYIYHKEHEGANLEEGRMRFREPTEQESEAMDFLLDFDY